MNFFKKDGEVYCFYNNQLEFIDDDYIAMSAVEIDRHLNPEKYLSKSEAQAQYLQSLGGVSRKQLRFALLEKGLLAKLEQAIQNIEDSAFKMKMEIYYTDSDVFLRSDKLLEDMLALLGLSYDQINKLWVEAINI